MKFANNFFLWTCHNFLMSFFFLFFFFSIAQARVNYKTLLWKVHVSTNKQKKNLIISYGALNTNILFLFDDKNEN